MNQNKNNFNAIKELNTAEKNLKYIRTLLSNYCVFIAHMLPKDTYTANEKYLIRTYRNLISRIENAENTICETVKKFK